MVEWLSHLETWLDESRIEECSKERTRTAVRNFARYLDGREPNRKLLIKWMHDWTGVESTMQCYCSAVRRFFTWLAGEGLYSDIGHGLRTYFRHQNEHQHLPLTDQDVERLLDHLNTYDQPCRRDLALCLMMLNCGLRCCEVVRARIQDLYVHDRRHLMRVQGKGHVYPDAAVMISDSLFSELAYYIQNRPGPRAPTDTIFRTLEHPFGPLSAHRLSLVIRIHLDAIGLSAPRYTGHSLRHTAATLALMRGATEEQVSKMLRHIDPRTTRIYTRFVDRMRNPAEEFLDFKIPGITPSKVLPLKRRA